MQTVFENGGQGSGQIVYNLKSGTLSSKLGVIPSAGPWLRCQWRLEATHARWRFCESDAPELVDRAVGERAIGLRTDDSALAGNNYGMFLPVHGQSRNTDKNDQFYDHFVGLLVMDLPKEERE